MVSACSLWSDSAWEVPWVSASLMATEQAVLASQMVWVQMALASLMDSAVLESFWRSSIPNSQTAFCLQVSMDDLVASSSSRALLAFSWSWPMFAGGVMLLDLGVTAMGEMVVGISPNEASAILTSSVVFTWDEVSNGFGRSFSLWGGGLSMTTGFGLFGVEFPDPWPDLSNIAWGRRLLTSMVMLTSLSSFGGVVLRGLDIMIAECLPRGNAFQSGSFAMGCGMLISRYMDPPPVKLLLLARDSGREVLMGSSCPFNPTG